MSGDMTTGDMIAVMVQLGVVFGGIVVFCVWQLLSVRRDQRADALKGSGGDPG